MDGNISNTPPIMFVPRHRGSRRAGTCWPRRSRRRRRRQRPASRRPVADFDKWLAQAKAADIAAKVPTDGLVLQAAADRRRRQVARLHRGRQAAINDARHGFAWEPGNGRQGVQSDKQGRQWKSQTLAISTTSKHSRSAPGSSSRPRADRRDRRPHGQHERLSRLGPVVREWQDRHAHHQQVAGRCPQGVDEERRSTRRTSGTTSSSPTTAPRKAAGVKIFLNGTLQPTDTMMRASSSRRRV